MDALTRLHAAAKPLLARVDATLASHGAPPDHPVWPLLLRCALLPGDAVAEVVAWEPEPLRERARLLAAHRGLCPAIDSLFRSPSTWDGSAAAAFAVRLDSTRAEHDTLASSTATLARHLDELADWIAHARTRLAHTLAATVSSAQSLELGAAAPNTRAALTKLVPPLPTALAKSAADIATEILSNADQFWRGALEISDTWSARLDIATTTTTRALAYPSPTLRVDL